MSRARWILLAVIVAALMWRHGTFDRQLAPVGLNVHECATNAYGATFCGAGLENYRRSVVAPMVRAQCEADEALAGSSAALARARCGLGPAQ